MAGSEFWVIFDVIMVAAGVFCIVAPDKAYNFGSKETREVPRRWHITSRIIGVIFVLGGIGFFIADRML